MPILAINVDVDAKFSVYNIVPQFYADVVKAAIVVVIGIDTIASIVGILGIIQDVAAHEFLIVIVIV